MREVWTNLRLRWRALWKRGQLESDLEDELAFHLAMRGEGARRAFGNVALVKEDRIGHAVARGVAYRSPAVDGVWLVLLRLESAGRVAEEAAAHDLVDRFSCNTRLCRGCR